MPNSFFRIPDHQVVQHPLKALLTAIDDLGGILGVVKRLDFGNGHPHDLGAKHHKVEFCVGCWL